MVIVDAGQLIHCSAWDNGYDINKIAVVYVCAYMCVCMYTCVCVCVCVCVHAHVCVCHITHVAPLHSMAFGVGCVGGSSMPARFALCGVVQK